MATPLPIRAGNSSLAQSLLLCRCHIRGPAAEPHRRTQQYWRVCSGCWARAVLGVAKPPVCSFIEGESFVIGARELPRSSPQFSRLACSAAG